MMRIIKTFNWTNLNWDRNAVFNELFLKENEAHFNDLLRARGYVFLRDIYENLGFEVTKESCMYGWRKVDNYISFNLSRIEDSADFELIFEIHPILDFIKPEDGVV